MKQSLFAEYTQKIMNGFSKLVETINEKRKDERTYLHKTMLRREYSADQKWEGASVNTNYVAADVVAMDSPLPIKKRDRVKTSSGELPKIGMKKVLKESQLNAINIMIAQHSGWAEIAKKLTDDAVACNVGIDEKNEFNFLQGLAYGIVLVQDTDNTGTGLRVDYGYLPENEFGVVTKGEVDEKDLQRVFDKAAADGNAITHIAISLGAYNKMRGMRWAREMAADYQHQTFDSQTQLRTPSASLFDEAFADNFGGIKFIKINRTVRVEKNGVETSVKPFGDERIVFLCSDMVGALVYGDLVESKKHVNGVDYALVDGFKLIKKYSTTEPYQECTAGEALCLPVIENVDQIYCLDTNDTIEPESSSSASESSSSAEVAKIILKGVAYEKAGVVAALKALGKKVTMNYGDQKILDAINELSDADEATFFANIESAKIEESSN